MQVLLLRPAEVSPGNVHVVQKFGHDGLRFARFTEGYIHTALIPIMDLLRPAMFVIDPYLLKTTYNMHKSFHEIYENSAVFPRTHFFKLHKFNFHDRSQLIGT